MLLLALLPALACAPVRTEAPSRTAALSDAPAAEPESTETEGWGDPDSGDEPYAPLPASEIESFSYRYGETLLLLFRDGDGTACLFAEKDGEAVQGTADASVLDALSDVLLREACSRLGRFLGQREETSLPAVRLLWRRHGDQCVGKRGGRTGGVCCGA